MAFWILKDELILLRGCHSASHDICIRIVEVVRDGRDSDRKSKISAVILAKRAFVELELWQVHHRPGYKAVRGKDASKPLMIRFNIPE